MNDIATIELETNRPDLFLTEPAYQLNRTQREVFIIVNRSIGRNATLGCGDDSRGSFRKAPVFST